MLLKSIYPDAKPISPLAGYVGLKLNHLLEDRGLTVVEIAKRVGMTRMGIYRILWGQIHVRVDTLEKLGKALGVHPGWFLEGYE